MKFLTLHIDAFMGAREREVTLAPGANLFLGENESGKSTLAAFVKYLLFGVKARKPIAGQTYEAARFAPLGGDGSYGGWAVVEREGVRYRLVRRSRQSGSRAARDTALSLTNLDTGEKVAGQPADFLLGRSEEVFLHSVYHAGGEFSVSCDEMRSAVQNIVSTGESGLDAGRAAENLKKKKKQLRADRGGGGALPALEREEQDIMANLASCDAQREMIESCEESRARKEEALRAKRGELAELERKIAAAEAREELRSLAAQREALSRREDARRALAAVEEEERAYRAAHGYIAPAPGAAKNDGDDESGNARCSQNSGENSQPRSESNPGERSGGESAALFFPDRSYEGEVARAAGDLSRAEDAVAAARTEVACLDGESMSEEGWDPAQGERLLEEIEAGKKTNRRLRAGVLAALPLILIALALGVAGVVFSKVPLAAAGFSAAAVGAAIVIVLLTVRRSRERRWRERLKSYGAGDENALRDTIARRREEISAASERQLFQRSAREALSRAEREREDALRRARELAGRWGRAVDSSEDLRAMQNELREVLSHADELRERRISARSLLSGLTRGEGEATAEQIAAREERAREALAAAAREGEAPLTAQELSECRKRRDICRESNPLVERSLHDLELQLAALKGGLPNPAELRRRLCEVQEKKSRLQARYDALELAIDALGTASAKLREQNLPRLRADASRTLAAATGGRYAAMMLDDTLEMSLQGRDGEPREPDYLSGGTLALAYLSLRLAAARLLFEGEPPPLLFDESFAALDDMRYRSALRAIRAFSEDGGAQVLLFSCQARDEAILREVFGEEANVVRMKLSDCQTHSVRI